MRDFETVEQDILTVTGTKLELAKQLNLGFVVTCFDIELVEAMRELAYEEGPGSSCFVALTYIMEPPAVALHRWDPAGGLASHLSYIGDFGGPRSFR